MCLLIANANKLTTHSGMRNCRCGSLAHTVVPPLGRPVPPPLGQDTLDHIQGQTKEGLGHGFLNA
jgi:hypothetical protein